MVPLPPRTWELDPESLKSSGFDDESTRVHAAAELDEELLEVEKNLRSGLISAQASAHMKSELRARHRQCWGIFSNA